MLLHLQTPYMSLGSSSCDSLVLKDNEAILTARWRLFKHVLLMSPDASTQCVIDFVLCKLRCHIVQGLTLPTALGVDLWCIGRELCCPANVKHSMHSIADIDSEF